MPDKLPRAVGKYVAGEEFWDREKELELFIDLLDHGSHILMSAQRRMGKTSLMKETSQRLESRYLCLYADLERCQNPEDAVAEIALLLQPYQKLWNKAKILFENAFKGIQKKIEEAGFKDLFWIKIRADLTAGDWKEKGDELFNILTTAQKPVILFLDEVPVLINNMLKDSDNRITPEGRKKQRNSCTGLEQTAWLIRGKSE